MPRPGSRGHFALVSGLMGTGHFLSHFYMICLPPVFPLLAAEFGLNNASLGLIVTIFAAATALSQVPSGILVDRFGALPVLVGGLFGLGTCMGMIGLVPAYPLILLLAAIAGLANGVFHPAGYTIMSATIGPGRIGKAFSIHQVGGSLGFIASPVAMIGLSSLFGWRTALLCIGFLAVVHCLVLLRFRAVLGAPAAADAKAAETAPQEPPAPFVALFRIPGLVPLFIAFVGGSFMNFGMQTFMVTILTGFHALDLANAANCLTIFLATATVGTLIGGALSDRTGRHAWLTAGAMIVSAVSLVLLSAATTPLLVLMIGLTVAGTFLGIMRTPRDMMVRTVAPPGAMGRSFSLFSIAISSGGAASPVLVGLMIDAGLVAWVFAVLAGVIALSAVMALLADRARLSKPARVSEAVS